MTAATDLWTATVAAYDTEALLNLTNIHDPAASSPDTTVGQTASQSVIDLWPAYAQVDYDSTNALHVEVGIRAVIATLWERGGSATSVAKQKWDDVFTDSMIDMLKRTGPRGRQGPSTNSGVEQKSELLSDGSRARPWADISALPIGFMPMGRSSADD